MPPRADPSAITCAGGAEGVNCAHTLTVPSREPDPRPVASITLTDDDLRAVGNSVEEWIAFAQRSAGSPSADAAVYVDGVPGRGELSAASIASINVNVDPFSAEFGGVHQLRIDVDSRAPDRRWRVQSALPSLGLGGGSPLASSGTPVTRHLSGGVSGPVASAPLTFSVSGSDRTDRRTPVFADASNGSVRAGPEGLRVSTNTRSITAGVVLTTPRALARLTAAAARMQADHSGVGGINAASTSQTLATADDYVRATWRLAGDTVLHRGGATVTRSRVEAVGGAQAPAIAVTGQASRGSNEIAAMHHEYFGWDAKHVWVVPAGRRPWMVGLEVQRTAIADSQKWNPYGRLQLESLTARTGTLTTAAAEGRAAAATMSAAIFGEQALWRSRAASVRAGGRVEWQNGDGVMVSPRLTGGMVLNGFRVSGGAGVFVQPWTPDVFAAAALRSASQFLVTPNVSGEKAGIVDPRPGSEPLRAVVAPSYTRRRDVLLQVGVERRVGVVRLGAERAWTAGTFLGGSVRRRDAAGLLDILDSDRRLKRARTHARVSVTTGRHAVVARYEHVSSMDDTDLTASLPAVQEDIGAEWAPSAAVARHAVTMTAGFTLPASIRMTVTYDTRTGARYNAISGTDDQGLAAFTSRAGLPRNAGVLPATRTLSMYLARSIRTKLLPKLTVDLGARADNVLNRENVSLVGRVLGSPLFGQPLAAAPGRSIRVWASVRR